LSTETTVLYYVKCIKINFPAIVERGFAKYSKENTRLEALLRLSEAHLLHEQGYVITVSGHVDNKI
jgi:hypothetical protein